MESTRRLSLTLLLVTPILARSVSPADLGLHGAAGWGGAEQTELQDWSGSTEPPAYDEPPVYDEGYGEFGSWLRRKRALDSQEQNDMEDMETAEQVLFRPTFRYKHLVKEREQRQKLREEIRRQYTQNSPAPAASAPVVASLRPSVPTAQRKYYNTYQQQQGVYTPRVPTAQRVYSPQPSPVQGVYSPQISSTQRVYSANAPGIVPNYQRIVANPSQYPKTLLFTQNNQGFRPQRSPYAYLYPQRLN